MKKSEAQLSEDFLRVDFAGKSVLNGKVNEKHTSFEWQENFLRIPLSLLDLKNEVEI